jgi:LmbE family N-acetylglucosaminyl deacetylase
VADSPWRFERVLVVSAHPDDPEFGYGAIVARFVDGGATVGYVICTDGSQGGEDPSVPTAELTATRCAEQRKAAAFLGVADVTFLGFPDGRLTADVALRRAIAAAIRRFAAQLVLTHLPVRVLSAGISHPDHLAVGEATLASIREDARCGVREVWMPGLRETDEYVDVTATMDRQVKAVLCHRSQFLAPGEDAGWAPERLAMVSSMRARMRDLGMRSGRGYEYASRVMRIPASSLLTPSAHLPV